MQTLSLAAMSFQRCPLTFISHPLSPSIYWWVHRQSFLCWPYQSADRSSNVVCPAWVSPLTTTTLIVRHIVISQSSATCNSQSARNTRQLGPEEMTRLIAGRWRYRFFHQYILVGLIESKVPDNDPRSQRSLHSCFYAKLKSMVGGLLPYSHTGPNTGTHWKVWRPEQHTFDYDVAGHILLYFGRQWRALLIINLSMLKVYNIIRHISRLKYINTLLHCRPTTSFCAVRICFGFQV